MRRLIIDVSFYVHATESEEKVLNSLEIIGIKPDSLRKERISGHYGNTILVFSAKLTGENAENVLRRLAGKLEENSRYILAYRLEEFMDRKGRIYIRLDKQELARGKAVLGQKDPVRLVVKLVGGGKRGTAAKLKELLLGR